MTMAIVGVLAFWTYAFFLGQVARREPDWLFWWGGHVGAVPGFFGLGGWSVASVIFLFHPIVSVPLAVGVAGGGVLIALPYVVRFLDAILIEGHARLTGVRSMKVTKTYDQAEALSQEGRREEALAWYAAEFGRDPKDFEAARRAGEACLELGRREKAMEWWRRSLDLMEEGEDRISLICRMSETLEGLDRREEARLLLEEGVEASKGTRFEGLLRRRISGI